MLVFIDALTRFPEVMVVKGTSAEQNIHAFSETFARHGIPRSVHSDNGAPFNGTDSGLPLSLRIVAKCENFRLIAKIFRGRSRNLRK